MRRKRQMNNLGKCVSHCMKSVQIRSFFWSVFSRIRTEYEEILRISQYSARIRKSTDQKKLRIWTLFTQCRGWLLLRHFSCLSHIYLHVQQKPKLSHTKIGGNSSGGEGEQQIISIVYLFLVIYNSLEQQLERYNFIYFPHMFTSCFLGQSRNQLFFVLLS